MKWLFLALAALVIAGCAAPRVVQRDRPALADLGALPPPPVAPPAAARVVAGAVCFSPEDALAILDYQRASVPVWAAEVMSRYEFYRGQRGDGG